MVFFVWLAFVFVFAAALAPLERPAASSVGFWVRCEAADVVFVLLLSEALAVVFAVERPVEDRLRVDGAFPSFFAVGLALAEDALREFLADRSSSAPEDCELFGVLFASGTFFAFSFAFNRAAALLLLGFVFVVVTAAVNLGSSFTTVSASLGVSLTWLASLVFNLLRRFKGLLAAFLEGLFVLLGESGPPFARSTRFGLSVGTDFAV